MSSSGSIRRAAALFSLLLTFAAFASFAGPAVTAWGAGFDGLFEAGDGTEKNPYVITTEKELRAFAARVDAERMNAGLFFKLGGDIDVSSANWTPIGNSRQFTGIFDGDGHKITGLNIPAEANVRYAGLFGRINGATIKNLRLETAAGGVVAASADSSYVYAGGVGGYAYILAGRKICQNSSACLEGTSFAFAYPYRIGKCFRSPE